MSTEYLVELQNKIDEIKTAYCGQADRIDDIGRLVGAIERISEAIRDIDQGIKVFMLVGSVYQHNAHFVEQMPYLFKMLLQDQITKNRAEIDELMKGLTFESRQSAP